MTTIHLKDGVLDVQEMGEGKPLLLLHSLLADRSVFDGIVPALARSRRVILPDLPGFGASTAAGGSIEAIADRLAGLFDALPLGPDCDVLGNGLGGFVASILAIRHGRRFDKLVLADTGLTFPPEGRAAFHVMADRVYETGMDGVADIAMKRLFPEPFIARNPGFISERRHALSKTDPAVFAQACKALAALDLRSQACSIANSTLVVVGELDAATPPALARELAAAIPGAHLIELPGLGHAPMAQDPEAFLAAIAPFLSLDQPERLVRLA